MRVRLLGGVGFKSRLRSLQLRGLMLSIQSRSPPSSRFGTVESAPTDMLTKEAKSSNSFLQVVMSIISNLVTSLSLFCGLDDEISPLCWFDVETTWLLLLVLPLALFRLIDNLVVDEMEPTLEGDEFKFRLRLVIPLLLLLEDKMGSMGSILSGSMGSIVSDDPILVKPVGG